MDQLSLPPKMRTAAIRADDILRIQKWIPRKKIYLLIKKGRERTANIKKNSLMYTWSHSINEILRKKRKQTIMLFPIEPMQSGLCWIQKSKQ